MARPEDNMVDPRESQTNQQWADDGSENMWDMDMDDEGLIGDEFADDSIDSNFEQVDRLDGLAPWRRIEIANENRLLQ